MTRRGGVGDASHLGLVIVGRQALGTCRTTLARRLARAVRRTAAQLAFPLFTFAALAVGVWLTLAGRA